MGPTPAVAHLRTAVREGLRRVPRLDESPGEGILVACSGGADSLALAAAAEFVAPRLGLWVGGITVDHGLQRGSETQAQRVHDQLMGLGLDPVRVVRVAVGTDGGPEAAARSARYAALAQAAAETGAAAVLLGHTLDDQAETVLLGLARGSGARSLAGMAAVSGMYRRPLLGVARALTRQACADLGLTPWEDPHNCDPRFTRVRVRREVLPLLEQVLGGEPSHAAGSGAALRGQPVARALARTADQLREDADALDAWAGQVWQSLVAQGATTDITLPVEALESLPKAIRTRLFRLAALATGSPAADLTAAHLAQVDALLTDWHGQAALTLPGPVTATRTRDSAHGAVVTFAASR